MSSKLIFLTIPGLREQDVEQMPQTTGLSSSGDQARIQHSFPAVTWPSQTNMLTGRANAEHGIVANGVFDRENHSVEMWTSWNEIIQAPPNLG